MSLKDIDTVVFDLNGTLYERGVALPVVNQTLDWLRRRNYRITFITNTDSKGPGAVHQMVRKMGLEIEEEEVYTPVSAVKAFMAKYPDKSFYFLVHDAVLADIQEYNRNENNPDCVVIGDFADKVSYKEINKVFRMVKAGAEMLALSKTLWYIDVDGYSINTGAFVSMLEKACAKEAVLLGKPSRAFFELGLARTKSSPEKTVVVGDDISVDVHGAKGIGALSILVKTGVFDAEKLQTSSFQPDYVIANVNELPDLLSREVKKPLVQ